MGEWDFSSTTEPNQHVEHKVVRKVVHPKYNFFTYENDLALVKTEKRVRFADNIIPICLPGNDDLLIGEWIQLKIEMNYNPPQIGFRKLCKCSNYPGHCLVPDVSSKNLNNH